MDIYLRRLPQKAFFWKPDLETRDEVVRSYDGQGTRTYRQSWLIWLRWDFTITREIKA